VRIVLDEAPGLYVIERTTQGDSEVDVAYKSVKVIKVSFWANPDSLPGRKSDKINPFQVFKLLHEVEFNIRCHGQSFLSKLLG